MANKIKTITVVIHEKKAGYWKIVNVGIPDVDLPTDEKNAPIRGPNMNPRENATPIKAYTNSYLHKYKWTMCTIALGRSTVVVTSVTTAVLILTIPLDRPANTLATKNNGKV